MSTKTSPMVKSTGAGLSPDENIWQALLEDVTAARAVETRNILVLGDRKAGKSTFLRNLALACQGTVKHPRDALISADSSELALSYHYINVREENGDDVVGRLGVWQLEGATSFGPLLRFALTRDMVERTAIVIALDMSSPATLESALQQWLDLLTTTVQELGLPKDTIGSPASRASLMVVVLKADAIAGFIQRRELRQAEFDFIQQRLRLLCLKFGASLVYVSSAQQSNLALFKHSVLSKLFGSTGAEASAAAAAVLADTPAAPSEDGVALTLASHGLTAGSFLPVNFGVPTSSLELISMPNLSRDTVYIPAGWDSAAKIALLSEGLDPKHPAANYQEADFAQVVGHVKGPGGVAVGPLAAGSASALDPADVPLDIDIPSTQEFYAFLSNQVPAPSANVVDFSHPGSQGPDGGADVADPLAGGFASPARPSHVSPSAMLAATPGADPLVGDAAAADEMANPDGARSPGIRRPAPPRSTTDPASPAPDSTFSGSQAASPLSNKNLGNFFKGLLNTSTSGNKPFGR